MNYNISLGQDDPAVVRFVTQHDWPKDFDLSYKKPNSVKDYDFELFKALVRAINCRYVVMAPREMEYGRKLKNDSWTGDIGMLYRNESDLAIDTITATSERLKAVDFSITYLEDSFAFFIRKPEVSNQQSKFFYLDPFQKEVWILLGLAYLVFYLSIRILQMNPNQVRRSLLETCGFINLIIKSNKLIKIEQTLNKSILALSNARRRDLSRCLRGFQILLLNTCVIIYGTTLTAKNNVFTKEPFIDTMEQLKQGILDGHYRTGAVFGSVEGELLKNSPSLPSYMRDSFEYIYLNKDDVFEQILRKNLAFNHMSRTYKMKMQRNNLLDKIHVVKEHLLPKTTVIPFRKGFRKSQILKYALLRYKETGILKKWEQDLMFEYYHEKYSLVLTSHFNLINMSGLRNIFALLILSHLMASLVFVLEAVRT